MSKYSVSEIESLLRLKCIEKMGDRYKNVWVRLVEKYAPRLNDSPLIKKVAFTNHDFSHHCKDIYVLIDKVLLKNINLNEEEYFVLAVAVLLHDISMTKENCDRLRHSKQSSDYIQDEVNNGEDAWNEVPAQHIPVIKQLVKAHSDVKKEDSDGKIYIENYTLRETDSELSGEFVKSIQVRWLAGILRLADELDVTNSRMRSGENRYENLDSLDESESESRIYWEQLNYFKEVTKHAATIKLVINEQYLMSHIDDDRGNIIGRIKKIHRKIEDCLKEVNEHAFNLTDEYTILISYVVISDTTQIFAEGELGNILERTPNTRVSHADVTDGKIGLGSNDMILASQDENDKCVQEGVFEQSELERKITMYIYSHDLIKHGHYRLNRRCCSTDWIDVRAMLSDDELGREIINALVKDAETVIGEGEMDVLLVGISMNGNILASQVAFKLGLPFTYLVPHKPGMEGSEMEKEFKIGQTKKVILFTGVISSYDTITNIICEYLTNVEVVKIYTVLLRPINNEYLLDEKREGIKDTIHNKIMYLNKDFDCEKLTVDKCVNAKYGQCIAQNKQAYDEVYQWSLAVKDEPDQRVFVNNVIGCDYKCSYCYLSNIGIWKKEIYTPDEVVAEFERLPGITADKYIISIGCYAECMEKDNFENILKIVRYFAQKKYYIQISTKSRIEEKWLEELERVLEFSGQLHIFVSIPTLSQTNIYENGIANIRDRLLNFKYQSKEGKICIYMYIKPYLTNITNQDIDKYLDLVKEYKMEVVVGNRFDFGISEGTPVQVGKNKMYESESDDMEGFILKLKQVTNVYRHSIEPIREMMEGRNV